MLTATKGCAPMATRILLRFGKRATLKGLMLPIYRSEGIFVRPSDTLGAIELDPSQGERVDGETEENR